MPRFYYTAIDPVGARISGEIEAGDAWLARKSLTRQELKILELRRFDLEAWLRRGFQRAKEWNSPLPLEEMLVFVSQLETGVSVGIPLIRLLALILDELKHPGFRIAVQRIIDRVGQGSSLHQAIAEHPEYFDATFTGLIEAGELSGDLEKILGRIFRLLEQQAENRARIRSAVFYPKLVVGFMGIVILVVVYFVIPKIQSFLSSFGQELPLITRLVVGFSNFMTSYWYLVLFTGFAIAQGFRRFQQTPHGRAWLDRTRLKLPILGPLFIQIELNHFCVVLDLLLESGIPIVAAIDTLRKSQASPTFGDDLHGIREEMVAGGTFRKALTRSPLFPSSLVGLIGIGEESGKIPEVLRRMAKHYQLQIDHRLGNLAKLIEPLLLGVIFIFTLILALAIFLPIWQMSSAVKGMR